MLYFPCGFHFRSILRTPNGSPSRFWTSFRTFSQFPMLPTYFLACFGVRMLPNKLVQPLLSHKVARFIIFPNIRWQELGIDPSFSNTAKSNIIVQISLHSFVISLGIDGLVEFHDPTWIYMDISYYKPIHISMQSYKYIDINNK